MNTERRLNLQAGFVSVTWLSRITPVEPDHEPVAEQALDRLFG